MSRRPSRKTRAAWRSRSSTPRATYWSSAGADLGSAPPAGSSQTTWTTHCRSSNQSHPNHQFPESSGAAPVDQPLRTVADEILVSYHAFDVEDADHANVDDRPYDD